MIGDSDIFEPYVQSIEIEICGKVRLMPENNTPLRCFQFLTLETASLGDFCWNGTCTNCQVWLEAGNASEPVLACRTKVRENIQIVKRSAEL